MMFKYFPHTSEDVEAMKEKIGIASVDELFQDVPEDVLFHHAYDIPSAMDEDGLRRLFKSLAEKTTSYTIFSGGGSYDHYRPSVIEPLISREEFQTAYTPYQPEVSQGTLQYIFEYQSMVQMLTGLDVSNASMYDGPTATAEACLMACAATKRDKVLVSKTLNPKTIAVVKTYLNTNNRMIVMIEEKNGVTDREDLKEKFDDDVAAVLIGKPNVFGIIEDIKSIGKLLENHKALLIENADISTLSVLSTPKEDGADIACGDCQSLGMPMAYGGPTLGYLASKKKYVRKMPGRICGMTKDKDNKRAYVLTLQAREQHIRREKANSNICSNQSLMVLYVTIYMSVMGKEGLIEVNKRSYQGAHVLAEGLINTGKFELAYDQPFFKEFTLKTNIDHDLIREALLEQGILGGISLAPLGESHERMVTFAVTERRTKDEIDKVIDILGGLS